MTPTGASPRDRCRVRTRPAPWTHRTLIVACIIAEIQRLRVGDRIRRAIRLIRQLRSWAERPPTLAIRRLASRLEAQDEPDPQKAGQSLPTIVDLISDRILAGRVKVCPCWQPRLLLPTG